MRKETVHTVSLHEIDVINSRTQGFLALFAGTFLLSLPSIRIRSFWDGINVVLVCFFFGHGVMVSRRYWRDQK